MSRVTTASPTPSLPSPRRTPGSHTARVSSKNLKEEDIPDIPDEFDEPHPELQIAFHSPLTNAVSPTAPTGLSPDPEGEKDPLVLLRDHIIATQHFLSRLSTDDRLESELEDRLSRLIVHRTESNRIISNLLEALPSDLAHLIKPPSFPETASPEHAQVDGLSMTLRAMYAETADLLISLGHVREAVDAQRSALVQSSRDVRGMRNALEGYRDRNREEVEAREAVVRWEERRVKEGLRGLGVRVVCEGEMQGFMMAMKAFEEKFGHAAAT